MSKVTAQIACEALINDPDAYPDFVQDARTVLADAIAAGVSPFYTDMLAEILEARA